MYLVPIHVPIYVQGERHFVTTEWRRALYLLRDSLDGRFGKLTVVAPGLPASAASQQTLEPIGISDGVETISAFDERARCRDFWLRHRSPWIALLRPLIRRAQMVHATMDDVYRPVSFTAFRLAVQQRRPTVFVQDTDIVLQSRELAANERPLRNLKRRAYALAFEQCVRWSVRRADLSLLKGAALMSRYQRFARNAYSFQDTSYSRDDIVPRAAIDERLRSLGQRPLRFVYCGRLDPRKGLMASLDLLKRANTGPRIQLHIIGDGAERTALENQTRQLGLENHVQFLGRMAYGRELIKTLATYDALLFTPRAEDTPRMIFDGYAAGVPLLGFDIDYLRERSAQDRAVLLLPRHDPAKAAAGIATLADNPAALLPLTEAAHAAAFNHNAETWYSRRAQWTIEAYERHAATTGRRASIMRP